MIRSTTLTVCAAAILAGALSAPRAHAHDPGPAMAAAANRLIATLSDEQKAAGLFEFTDPKRTGWYFVPDKFIKPAGKRFGVLLSKMSPQQRLLTHALLTTVLSADGHSTVVQVMSLERVLHDMENKNPIRKADLYYVSIFGTPSETGTWSWRFEGHHLSINATVVNGQLLSVTPSFFGANPGEVKSGPMKGMRVLAVEEDLARQLVKSLNDEQRKVAIIADKAPSDIITKQKPKADRGNFTPQKGIAFDKLDDAQQKLLFQLIKAYAAKYRPAVFKKLKSKSTKSLFTGEGVTFAWAGGTEKGEGHYYFVQTPAYLFEYDSTQNKANHIHAVWRDFDGDFGEDLLKEHYKAAHSK